MAPSHLDFVDVVAAARGLVVTHVDAHVCRLEPRASDLGWHCELDDGTTKGELDPASFVRWVCPQLRDRGTTSTAQLPLLAVRRSGPQSDLGKLVRGLGRLTGAASRRGPFGSPGTRYDYTDPAGILDAGLRRRIESWPPAQHGDGVVRPVELWSIHRNREGLVVESASWWGSAPALDHQVGLALEIARRLTTQDQLPRPPDR